MKLIKHPNVVQLHEVYFFVRRDDASFITFS